MGSPLANTLVFEPLKVGDVTLSNRIVYCPTTRFRAAPSSDGKFNHLPSDLMLEYYSQRAQYPGTLLVTEATFVSRAAGGYDGAPALYTQEETQAWKKIVDAVHARKSFISCQAWFLGRVADARVMKNEGQKLVGASAIYPDERSEHIAKKAGLELTELTVDEIQRIIKEDFTIAAKNAMKAGFDFFELHNAHGYMLDTFLHENSNQRKDQYGGLIENRARFTLELIDHLCTVIPPLKLAIRLSPWAEIQGVYEETSPIPQFSYLLDQLQKRANNGKELGYVSVVEPRVQGVVNADMDSMKGNNEFVEQVWKGVILRAGNYTYDAPEFNQIKKDISNGRTLVGFSRFFTSNPDLVEKLKTDPSKLVRYDRSLFYAPFNWGYNTFDGKHYDEETEKKRFAKPIKHGEANL
ncbi:hypothetical protein LELG_04733 [Lodderomyces elongisporus NRRL YB-4239]|uniref:Probable NADPH dehydrogenase n=1 Tax=Lodderomyces elongisporus (strain ATCC 11503 / CBS 2605 / JCM 1781 / NBRC 1676 / NRRL YB-4239) TaxID=379508 RepID=A5E544_LODEL|nr:hypothetical protein LELG_04733 [Lodderomyces elongisporus NRRL YB-4239]